MGSGVGSGTGVGSVGGMLLSSALSLARKHMPVGVASIRYELFRAEHTVAQLKLKGAHRPPRPPHCMQR